jgi:hypothetical protein
MKRQKTGGRIKGVSTNVITRPLKELITDVLTNDLNEILTNGHTMSPSERESRIRCVYMLGRLIIKPTQDLEQTSQPIIVISDKL